jgi:hypothetical protein
MKRTEAAQSPAASSSDRLYSRSLYSWNACQKIKQLVTSALVWGMSVTPMAAIQSIDSSAAGDLDKVLNLMRAHEEWQNRHLVEYQVHRKFYAENSRFRQQSVLEVTTRFRSPSTFESEVVRSEGSQLIRERVFDKILEAEKEAGVKAAKGEVAITPANYHFSLVAKHDCGGRSCYVLQIAPKQKNKYSVNGRIWVDAEDGAIVRLQGTPAVRPSFWTLSTDIERRYKRINGVWLCIDMESTSNILVAGRSTLKINYDYLEIETENNPG